MNTEPIKLRRSPRFIEMQEQVEADNVLDTFIRLLCESQPAGYVLGGLLWGDDALHVTWMRDDSNIIPLEVIQDGS